VKSHLSLYISTEEESANVRELCILYENYATQLFSSNDMQHDVVQQHVVHILLGDAASSSSLANPHWLSHWDIILTEWQHRFSAIIHQLDVPHNS